MTTYFASGAHPSPSRASGTPPRSMKLPDVATALGALSLREQERRHHHQVSRDTNLTLAIVTLAGAGTALAVLLSIGPPIG